MTNQIASKRIIEIFKVKSGDFHATKELDEGNTPLISCGDSDNGCIGYFEIPSDKVYKRSITVAYNGQPLTTKFHPYEFGAKDDVAVLIPNQPLKDITLLYIATLIDKNKWRYSYGRKCFREKLSHFSLDLPINENGEIDEEFINGIFSKQFRDFIPSKKSSGIKNVPIFRWHNFSILDLFDPKRGDFHSITDLDDGKYMTISRVTSDNGVVGYFDKPDDADEYDKGYLTLSTVGGDVFVQMGKFIATDNVIVCVPKKPLLPSTLFFIAFILNRQKWRYSYGRQCYMNKVSKINFQLPVTDSGELDEVGMEKIIEQASYWHEVKAKFL